MRRDAADDGQRLLSRRYEDASKQGTGVFCPGASIRSQECRTKAQSVNFKHVLALARVTNVVFKRFIILRLRSGQTQEARHKT